MDAAPLALAGPFCPWIRHAGTWNRTAPWSLGVRRLGDWLLVHCAGGEERIAIDGVERRIADGDTYLVQPGQTVVKRSDTGNRPTTVHFDLVWNPRRAAAPPAPYGTTSLAGRRAWLQPAARAVFGVDLPAVLPRALRGRCAAVIPSLAELWQRGTVGDALAAHLRLVELLMACREASGGGMAISDHERLERAMAHAREALDQPLSTADLARAAGWATSRFYERWRALRDDTPAGFLRGERMALARRLLADGAVPVAAVAARCGYAQPTVFGRVFRAATGETPSTWRGRRISGG